MRVYNHINITQYYIIFPNQQLLNYLVEFNRYFNEYTQKKTVVNCLQKKMGKALKSGIVQGRSRVNDLVNAQNSKTHPTLQTAIHSHS